MKSLDPLDQMLTPSEAAQWLRMSERNFLRKGRSESIPVFKLGHSQVRAHPRTIIAKLAHDAGVEPEVIRSGLMLPQKPALANG
jgi:hypothetical protein